MRLFDRNTTASICLQTDLESVRLAALDLQRDLRRLAGNPRGFAISHCGSIIVSICPGEAESYTVTVDSQVHITGGDALGAVYGIYAFARRCLNILPVHRLVDVFPETVESLELSPCTFASSKRAVQWRGWFLNDEDLLTELVYSGGKRHIDYPFYGDVVDVAVLDRILETALRLEMNLIIPASFVDILNLPERKLVDVVCRRGLYISQHHVEPVGVSYFAADAYIRKHGRAGETVSFVTNRSRTEEIWKTYIAAWAEYGHQVVWQLGLRGKGDQAVWKADPNAPMTDEARGRLITEAIATQYAMIREAVGEGFASTATLWNEGSALYGQGLLQLPADTIAIFSDFGISQMFGEDFHSLPRGKDKRYGVYYHSAFWALGPHLAEGCRPEKMVYSLKEAYNRNSLHYAILNVSNVRPVHYGAMVFAKLLQDPSSDAQTITQELDKALFGEQGKEINSLRIAYYDAFADFGRDALRMAANKWQFYYHSYEDLPFVENAVTDGYLAYYTKGLLRGVPCAAQPEKQLARAALELSEGKFAAVYEKLCALPPNGYLERFLKYQTGHMLLLTQWSLAVMDMLAGKSEAKAIACEKLSGLLEDRRVLEEGSWQNWHRGDKKINIPLLLQMTKDWH